MEIKLFSEIDSFLVKIGFAKWNGFDQSNEVNRSKGKWNVQYLFCVKKMKNMSEKLKSMVWKIGMNPIRSSKKLNELDGELREGEIFK